MVRQQSDDLDRLGTGQKPRWPRPLQRPGGAHFVRRRCNPLDAAFGHVTCDRRDTENPLAATIAEHIDERRHVRHLLLDQGRGRLNLGEWFDEGRGEAELLDAETGFDPLEAIAEELHQPGNIADRLCGPGPERLHGVVNAVNEEVGATHAEPALFELKAKLAHQPADVLLDGFHSADRFGKGLVEFDQVRRPDRIDGFRDPPEHLVETAPHLRAEAKGQWGARRRF